MALISVSTLVSAGSMYYWYFVRLLEFKKNSLTNDRNAINSKGNENNLYGAFGARLESSNFHVAIRFFFLSVFHN